MMTHLSIAVIIADMKKRQLIVMIAVIIYFITNMTAIAVIITAMENAN